MYTLISAIAKPLNGNGRWMVVSIGDISLNLLYNTYSRVIATLSNPFLTKHVAVELNSLQGQLAGLVITFNEFLVSNANNTIVALPEIPTYTAHYAKYADAFHAGYKIRPIRGQDAVDSPVPLHEKTRLYLTRPETDYALFGNSCLVNVNGFFHRTETGPQGIYVDEGMTSQFMSGHNQIGILSFRELGSIRIKPIDLLSNMLYKQNERQLYKDRTYVNLQEDITNKTIMLVLGGYLHVLDKSTFYRVSETCVCVEIGNLPLIARYYESRKYIDLSSLNLETTNRNDAQISVADFYKDETIQRLFALSQSFFVILDNPDIFVEKSPVGRSMLLDAFISDEKPLYPLVVGRGKITNYWYVHEDKQYSLHAHDTAYHNYIFDTVILKKESSVSDQRDTMHPFYPSSAYYLKIGTELS